MNCWARVAKLGDTSKMVAQVDAALTHNAPQGAVKLAAKNMIRRKCASQICGCSCINKRLLCQRPTMGSYRCGHLMLTKSTILQALHYCVSKPNVVLCLQGSYNSTRLFHAHRNKRNKKKTQLTLCKNVTVHVWANIFSNRVASITD